MLLNFDLLQTIRTKDAVICISKYMLTSLRYQSNETSNSVSSSAPDKMTNGLDILSVMQADAYYHFLVRDGESGADNLASNSSFVGAETSTYCSHVDDKR